MLLIVCSMFVSSLFAVGTHENDLPVVVIVNAVHLPVAVGAVRIFDGLVAVKLEQIGHELLQIRQLRVTELQVRMLGIG